MNHQLSSTECMIRKTVGYHYKGIFVGILLGIVGTILVQNATMPAWLKKTDVPPEPNPSAGIIPYDPPTPNLKSGIMPSDPKIIPTTPICRPCCSRRGRTF